MPREARKLSGSNIYHVMLRGINRQDIFEDDSDRRHFMFVLKECKEISGFRLHAFVLMSNHIHLLIEPADEPLDTVIRRIGIRYAVWYNRKYQRAGHLFQDRFRSENVETDQYYMTVLRYILRNPAKAGMEARPGSYRWSSYAAYEKGGGTVTDTQYALDLFGGRENLVQFVAQENEDSVMDEEAFDWRLREDLAKETAERITGCSSVSAFQQLEASVRKEYVGKMYQGGLSMSQIARMTGISKATVFRTIQKQKEQHIETEEKELILRESETIEFYLDDSIIW